MGNQLVSRLRDEGIELDEVALDRLGRFTDILMEWNGTHNLTGVHTVSAVHDNIVDALYPLTFIPRPNSLLDVGTGAGFPGLVLAIAWPDVPTVLAEPQGKRAAFLRFMGAELELGQVEVARARVEDLHRAPFDLITSRAVTDTKLLLDITRHIADSQTHYLFYKGSRAAKELETLETQPNYAIVQYAKRNYIWIK